MHYHATIGGKILGRWVNKGDGAVYIPRDFPLRRCIRRSITRLMLDKMERAAYAMAFAYPEHLEYYRWLRYTLPNRQ